MAGTQRRLDPFTQRTFKVLARTHFSARGAPLYLGDKARGDRHTKVGLK